jgi:hypothetical protein
MFQRYAESIDPENEQFLTFISQYLAERNVRDPREVPYSQLYRHIKEGIRSYVRQQESAKKPNSDATDSR